MTDEDVCMSKKSQLNKYAALQKQFDQASPSGIQLNPPKMRWGLAALFAGTAFAGTGLYFSSASPSSEMPPAPVPTQSTVPVTNAAIAFPFAAAAAAPTPAPAPVPAPAPTPTPAPTPAVPYVMCVLPTPSACNAAGSVLNSGNIELAPPGYQKRTQSVTNCTVAGIHYNQTLIIGPLGGSVANKPANGNQGPVPGIVSLDSTNCQAKRGLFLPFTPL
jgi:hypothetical protein